MRVLNHVLIRQFLLRLLLYLIYLIQVGFLEFFQLIILINETFHIIQPWANCGVASQGGCVGLARMLKLPSIIRSYYLLAASSQATTSN